MLRNGPHFDSFNRNKGHEHNSDQSTKQRMQCQVTKRGLKHGKTSEMSARTKPCKTAQKEQTEANVLHDCRFALPDTLDTDLASSCVAPKLSPNPLSLV